MLAQMVAKKYSTALFNIVKEKQMIDVAIEQFGQLDELINTDRSLLQFLLAPHILDGHKVDLVKTIFAKRLEPLFLEFLLLLVRKYRIGFLHEIIEEFRERVHTERGMIQAKIVTATTLTDQQRSDLKVKLAAKTGKKITLDEKIDPAILGGMVVIVGDQIIDGSVRHHLSVLKEGLMKLKMA